MEDSGIKLSFHMALLISTHYYTECLLCMGPSINWEGGGFSKVGQNCWQIVLKNYQHVKNPVNGWLPLWMVSMQTFLFWFSLLQCFRTFRKYLTEVIRMYLIWYNFLVYMHSIFFNWVVDLQQLFFDAFTTYCLYKCSWYIR